MKKQILLLISSAFFALNAAHGMDPTAVKDKDTSTPPRSSYALGHDQAAADRLDKQDERLWPETLSTLKKEEGGLTTGQTIIDWGCGTGSTVIRLAKEVGETGSVYGIDINEAFINRGRAKAIAEGQENVEFIPADAQLPIARLSAVRAHIAFTRLAIMHVGNPKGMIDEIKKLLKEGGKVVSIEPAIEKSYYQPSHEVVPAYKVFDEYKSLVLKIGGKKQTDYNIGSHLKDYYTEKGFIHVITNYNKEELTLKAAKYGLLSLFPEMSKSAKEEGVATDEALENLKKGLEALPDNTNLSDFTYYSVRAHVVAQKPKEQ